MGHANVGDGLTNITLSPKFGNDIVVDIVNNGDGPAVIIKSTISTSWS